jgi:hypothetical protein
MRCIHSHHTTLFHLIKDTFWQQASKLPTADGVKLLEAANKANLMAQRWRQCATAALIVKLSRTSANVSSLTLPQCHGSFERALAEECVSRPTQLEGT